VFIVGAGASADFKLPLGAKLVESIREQLVSELAGPSREGIISQAINSGKEGDYGAAARDVAGGMVAARSIDRFLDSRRAHELTVFLGKCAIAHRLLEAEEKSTLGEREATDWKAAHLLLTASRKSWLHSTFSILHEGVKPDDHAEVLRDVSFITFNYDRCIERYLQLAFEHVMSLPTATAHETASRVPITHVYGSLGDFPTPVAEGVPYGADAGHMLSAASNLRTFTEGATAETLELARAQIANAEQIIVLGFAFDPVNISALFDSPLAEDVTVFGTAYSVDQSELEPFKRMAAGGDRQFQLLDTTCEEYCKMVRFRGHLRGD
jgi:hypothetical protein